MATLDPPLQPNELNALLGRGTLYEGKLHFEGAVRIDGTFRGEIRSDDTLVIGDGAHVEGSIDVATVIIKGGRVIADIHARRSIELYVPARVEGNLHAPEVMLEKGVQFEGNCRMAPVEDPNRGGLPSASLPAAAPALGGDGPFMPSPAASGPVLPAPVPPPASPLSPTPPPPPPPTSAGVDSETGEDEDLDGVAPPV